MLDLQSLWPYPAASPVRLFFWTRPPPRPPEISAGKYDVAATW